MARHTLLAYVEGSDLGDLAGELEAQFDQFVGSRTWNSPDVWIVNQRQDRNSAKSNDLPQWDLGLNMELPDAGKETPGWFSDVEAIAQFLGELHATTGRNFFIGIHDNDAGFNEDLFTVSSTTPDLAQLRAIIGVGPVD